MSRIVGLLNYVGELFGDRYRDCRGNVCGCCGAGAHCHPYGELPALWRVNYLRLRVTVQPQANSRLDAGANDAQTIADRDFLTAWFWETCGTFGVKYNFNEKPSESG